MKQVLLTLIFFCYAAVGMAQTPPSCIDSSQICPVCPCILIYDPVCGCDDVTYSNSCFAFFAGATEWIDGFVTCADVATNCLAPARLLEQSFEPGGVRLDWYPPIGNGAIAYRVQGRVAGSTAWQSSPVISAPDTDFLVPNAFFTSGETYEWRVQSSCSPLGVNLGPESSVESFTFPAAREGQSSTIESNISIFPNPASSMVTISHVGSSDQDVTVRMFDQFGRLVSETSVQLGAGWTAEYLFVDDLPNGVYMVQIDNGISTTSQSLAVTR